MPKTNRIARNPSFPHLAMKSGQPHPNTHARREMRRRAWDALVKFSHSPENAVCCKAKIVVLGDIIGGTRMQRMITCGHVSVPSMDIRATACAAHTAVPFRSIVVVASDLGMPFKPANAVDRAAREAIFDDSPKPRHASETSIAKCAHRTMTARKLKKLAKIRRRQASAEERLIELRAPRFGKSSFMRNRFAAVHALAFTFGNSSARAPMLPLIAEILAHV